MSYSTSYQRLHTAALRETETRTQAFYLYDLEGIRQRALFLKACLAPVQIFYAMKANANPRILRALAQLDLGVDVVSGGELKLALECGFTPNKIVFSGVGKTSDELQLAMQHNILQVNVESVEELLRIQKLAARRHLQPPLAAGAESSSSSLTTPRVKKSDALSTPSSRGSLQPPLAARGNLQPPLGVALRLNPDVDADTHPHIRTGCKDDKFGLDAQALRRAKEILREARGVQLVGLSVHIGSQIFKAEPFLKSIQNVLSVYRQLQQEGFRLQTLDIGGGWGVDYAKDGGDEEWMQHFAQQLKPILQTTNTSLQNKTTTTQKPSPSPSLSSGEDLMWLAEPGRVLVGRFAWLVARVEYIKTTAHKKFVILNTGMHHFMRPALYGAQHRIEVVQCAAQKLQPLLDDVADAKKMLEGERVGVAGDGSQVDFEVYDVVGPICESADTFARDVKLPRLTEGDWLALCDTGAYGFVMANQYNGHPLPDEVFV